MLRVASSSSSLPCRAASSSTDRATALRLKVSSKTSVSLLASLLDRSSVSKPISGCVSPVAGPAIGFSISFADSTGAVSDFCSVSGNGTPTSLGISCCPVSSKIVELSIAMSSPSLLFSLTAKSLVFASTFLAKASSISKVSSTLFSSLGIFVVSGASKMSSSDTS